MKRILYINPVGISAWDQAVANECKSVASKGVQIDVCSLVKHSSVATLSALDAGRPHKVPFVIIISAPYLSDLSRSNARRGRPHRDEGYDGYIIGCFYDPALWDTREAVRGVGGGKMVVAAPCEAACGIAASLGRKFSILIGRKKWHAWMHENVVRSGHADHLASFRVLNMGVEEFQKDPKVTEARMLEEARKAIDEDGAEVIILGCTIEFGFYKVMQKELGVPVIDAIVAPIRQAEMMIENGQRFGWSPSNANCCEPPPDKELEGWGVFADNTKATLIGNLIEAGPEEG